MNTNTPPIELNGIALSQEELLAALVIAQLPTLPGYDDLQTRVFGDLPDAIRPSLMEAAERTLLARGLLDMNAEGATLNAAVHDLLQVATQPQRSWVVLYQPAAQVQRASYFHQRDETTVAHFEQYGVHQLLQIGGTTDIQATVMQLVDPLPDANPPASWVGTLPESTFAQLVGTNGEPPSATVVRDTLQAAGWNAEAAEAFTAALEQLVAILAFARFNFAAEPPLNRAFTIVRGQASQWALTLTAPNQLKVQAVSGQLMMQALEEFGGVG